jgi:uncharacterized protein (TIGR04255 family)
MTVRYRETPLTEAVFEFLPEGASLDLDGLARVRSELSEFAGKKDEVTGISVRLGLDGMQQRQEPVRYRHWNRDNTRLWQVGDDMCAFNVLKPYTHYVEYLEVMERLVRTYTAVANPKSTKMIGQRYLNRILLPSDGSPADFFTAYPSDSAVRALGHPPFSLQMQTESLTGEGGGKVFVTLVYQGLDAGSRPTYMLDLYATSQENPPIPFAWESLKAWQDNAHGAVKRAFEFSITDRCRELLEWEEL